MNNACGQAVPEADLFRQLKEFSTTELCDAAGLLSVMDSGIRRWVGTGRIAGIAVTVDVPSGESDIISDAIALLKEHDILVISGKSNCSCSYWGDYRSFCASLQNAEGVIIDGAFRDIDECEAIGFPVFARDLTCRAGLKSGKGTVNTVVSCGGVTVKPGDLIVADRNGIIILDAEHAQNVMRKALEKREREEAAVARMKETGIVIPRIPKTL